MAKGSCSCGEFTYEVQGEPSFVAICHCIPCKKTAGANGSYNWMVPGDKIKHLSGPIKRWTRKGDSGKGVHYTLCDTCGTIMYGDLENAPGMYVLKAGTLDDKDAEEKYGKPAGEIYTKNRPSWCGAWQGAAQKETT